MCRRSAERREFGSTEGKSGGDSMERPVVGVRHVVQLRSSHSSNCPEEGPSSHTVPSPKSVVDYSWAGLIMLTNSATTTTCGQNQESSIGTWFGSRLTAAWSMPSFSGSSTSH